MHNYTDNGSINNLPLSDYRDLLSVSDLAAIFNVSKNTIYKEIQEGKFGKPIQIGRAFKVPKVFILQNFSLTIDT
jgi:predicted DNA-binding transcriptional regulator YafY